MARVDPDKVLTLAEAARLDPDEAAGEVLDGRWAPVARGTWRHGEIVANIVVALELWARENPGWRVATADPGVRLAEEPARLRGPDVAVIPEDRVPEGEGQEGWLLGAPTVAVEVAGDRQSHASLVEKALEYIQAGAELVWVVDPRAEQVIVYRPGNRIDLVARGGALTGEGVLPGFRCDLREVFA